ncbi:MAG: DUF6306 domain-containing protein [Pseudomonadota bacterium]
MTGSAARTNPDVAPPEEDPNVTPACSSPPCWMHELDPSYLGYLDRDETLVLLRALLQARRKGAATACALSETPRDPAVTAFLTAMAEDEARFGLLLRRHMACLGGNPEEEEDDDGRIEAVLAADAGRVSLAGLVKDQAEAARRLREALPRIHDDSLHGDLRNMAVAHERAAERLASFSLEAVTGETAPTDSA